MQELPVGDPLAAADNGNPVGPTLVDLVVQEK